MRDEFDMDYDYGFDEEKDELRRRVERKRNKAATNRLTKKADFCVYLEEDGPLNMERELGIQIDRSRMFDQ